MKFSNVITFVGVILYTGNGWIAVFSPGGPHLRIKDTIIRLVALNRRYLPSVARRRRCRSRR